jgi:hypothetical protein
METTVDGLIFGKDGKVTGGPVPKIVEYLLEVNSRMKKIPRKQISILQLL